MSITRHITTTYQTEDGRVHASELDARNHELLLRTRGVLQTLSNSKTDVISFTDLAKLLLAKSEEFTNEFSKIKRCKTDLSKSPLYLKTVIARNTPRNGALTVS